MAQTRGQTPQVGDKAPGFTLKDTGMKDVSLEQLRGKAIILVFFPAAFSSVCTSELCAFRQQLGSIDEHDACVLGISVDLPYALRKFKQVEQLSFSLLSDFDRVAINAYGVVDGDFNGYRSGVAQRSIFVIDPEGTIAWQWVSDHQGQEPEYPEVIEAVAQLRLVERV